MTLSDFFAGGGEAVIVCGESPAAGLTPDSEGEPGFCAVVVTGAPPGAEACAPGAAFLFPCPKGSNFLIQLARPEAGFVETGCVPSTKTSWVAARGLFAVSTWVWLSIGATITPRGGVNG